MASISERDAVWQVPDHDESYLWNMWLLLQIELLIAQEYDII
jgi:hypothetical protein